MEVESIQKALCNQFGVEHFPSPSHLKIGIAKNVKVSQNFPINGLRHTPEGDTTGWYIWAGEEFSDIADFFSPLCVEHIPVWCPAIIKFLGLPPGFRFLIGEGGYEDIWFDKDLLK